MIIEATLWGKDYKAQEGKQRDYLGDKIVFKEGYVSN